LVLVWGRVNLQREPVTTLTSLRDALTKPHPLDISIFFITYTSDHSISVHGVHNGRRVLGTDHATGLEKYELLAKEAGTDDPFLLKAVARGDGTKDSPTIVNAMDTYRMVGCVCNEEDTNVKWMWLCEGVPKRCECGYWFSLKVHPAPDKYQLPL
jgi:cytochrome c oxidase subunit 5b